MSEQIPDHVKQNQELIKSMMEKAGAGKAAETIAQGNKAIIPVDIDYTADSGNHYEGQLLFRRPSTYDYLKIGARKSEMLRLLGVQPNFVAMPDGKFIESMAHLDPMMVQVTGALATCVVLITDGPDWVKKLDDLEDPDLALFVYQRFDQELSSFRRQPTVAPTASQENGPDTGDVESKETIRG